MKKHWFVLMLVFVVSTVNAAIDDHQNSSSFVADGEVGGYEYVNLGLPSGTLWATCNVGASSPYESGSYFAWGETETKDIYTWENYKFFKDMILTRQLARMRFWNTSEKISVEPNMMQQLNNGEMAGVFLMTKKPMNCECIAGVNGPLKRA